MPWEQIIGAASGTTIGLIVGLWLFKTYIESSLRRSEDTFRQLLEQQASIDTDLREKRLTVYKVLWQKMGMLSKWPKNEELTYGDLQQLCREFRDWYFNEGGIFLSSSARKIYGELQERLVNVFEKNAKDKVEITDYEEIRKQFSNLRSEITTDLLSRKPAASF